MDKDETETLCLKALAWLAANTDIMDRFSALTGIAPHDMLKQAGNPEAQAGLLDFLLSDERVLVQFCQAHDIPSTLPAQARQQLVGGDLPNWT